MTDHAAIKARNAARWAAMQIHTNRVHEFDEAARAYCAVEVKQRFEAVTRRLVQLGYQAVPWWFIAVIAEREYGRDKHGNVRWDAQLAQGDPLHAVSHHEPAHRGPFFDHPGDDINNNAWLRGCLDALIDCAPHAARNEDWSVGGVLTLWEDYNGEGYEPHASPYLWSGTDQYVKGKFIRDHVYDENEVDVQLGCAALIARMKVVDPTIKFGEPQMTDTTQTAPAPGSPAPHPIDFAKIEAAVETVAHFLPIVANFYPPLQPFLGIVPVAEGLLKMADEIESAIESKKGTDAVLAIVSNHLHGMSGNVASLIKDPHLLPALGIKLPPTLVIPQQAGQPQASSGG